jgi:chitinase
LVGTWDTYSSSASPLKTCGSDASATSAVAAWTGAGFPASKLLLGIPAYATSFTTLSSTLATTTIDGYKTKIRQKISKTIPKGASGDTKQAGTDVCGVKSQGSYSGQYAMKELISEGLLSSNELSGKGGYQRVWDSCTQTPFLFSKTKKHLITYEDSKSTAQKVAWARKKGLAGVMVFDTTGFTDAVYDVIADNLSTSVSKRHLNIGSLSHA